MRDRSRPLRDLTTCRRCLAGLAAGLALAAILAVPASAGTNLFVGVDDIAFLEHPAEALPVAQDLGMSAVRVAITWHAGQQVLGPAETAQLSGLVSSPIQPRIVVSVYGTSPWAAPMSDTGRNEYCAYVGSVLQDFPTINDVVIWNEPNLSYFWRPQFNPDGSSAAPAAYEALLARCYDVLHGIRPGVNVIAPATCPRGNDIAWSPDSVSLSPGQFIRGMGEAYRTSGRTRPLFDTVGHHVYGTYSAERPWRVHTYSTAISEGDWHSLMDALTDAFNGTAQLVPGQCSGVSCMSIWYLEAGYQTTIDPDKAWIYRGTETFLHLVPAAGGPPDPPDPPDTSWAPDQATQIRDGLRLAYCQPYVEAFFNFLLIDETALGGWQSGVLWGDWSPKPSYQAFKDAIAAVNSRTIDCTPVHRTQAAAGAVVDPSHPGVGVRSQDQAPRPLRLYISVRPRVRVGSLMHVWLRFSRAVTGERVVLLRVRKKRTNVVLHRNVDGFAPVLKLKARKAGRFVFRIAYEDGSAYRWTRTRTVRIVPKARRRN